MTRNDARRSALAAKAAKSSVNEDAPGRIWLALLLWIIAVLVAVYAWDTFVGSGDLFRSE